MTGSTGTNPFQRERCIAFGRGVTITVQVTARNSAGETVPTAVDVGVT